MGDRRGPWGGYQEHAPAPDLARWIECFWTRGPDPAAPPAPRAAPPDEPLRILPDGCADVIFALGDRVEAFAVGPMTGPLVLPPAPAVPMLGVRFHPGAAGALLGVPLKALVDARVPLDALWPDAAELRERIEETARTRGAIDAFEALLRGKLGDARVAFPVGALVRRMALAPESASVATLAAEAGLTRQHLRRVFEHHVGYGPKKLARILRLRRALRLIASRGAGTLAEIALDAGYYDQAHMNADFRDLAGRPPLAFAPPPASPSPAMFHSSKTGRSAGRTLQP